MLNPFISIFSTENLSNKAGELKHIWEHFVTSSTNKDNLSPIVRSEIFNSWNRCQTIGINPEQKQARTALTPFELNNLLAQSILYRAAKPIIDNIYLKLIGTGYLVTLNDENGKMIYLKGDSDLIRETEKMNFSPGMDWSEQAAGTNAIGTSIVAKMPIQVFSAEHFCEGFHSMTCSSSPIFHPYTKKVIGAVDLTGFWPSTQPHTLGLAVSLAQIIEQQLFVLYREKYNQLEEYYQQYSTQWHDNAVIVFSDEYMLVNGDETLLHALQLKKGMVFESEQQLKTYFQNQSNSENGLEGYDLLQIKAICTAQEEIGYITIFKKKRTFTPYHSTSHPLIGESPELKAILSKCQQIAPINTPILLTGETGTGKEVIARYIHEISPRKNQPFVAINCGTIPKELISSELFGYESGTFTGGKKEGKKGKFEEANGGTIFLDEIGEMPLDLQVHLLRVLQEQEVTRLGTSKTIKLNVKIITATNRNLESMVKQGSFRQDLYFRLNVISFNVPTLRKRKEDILLISQYYLNLFAKEYKKPFHFYLSEKAKNFFLHYDWPGNIRELRNVIEHAVIFGDTAEIEQRHLPDYLVEINNKQVLLLTKDTHLSVIEDSEMQHIKSLLQQNNWNISAVSKELNIARSTLYRKLKKYNLKEHSFTQ